MGARAHRRDLAVRARDGDGDRREKEDVAPRFVGEGDEGELEDGLRAVGLRLCFPCSPCSVRRAAAPPS